MPGTNVFPDWVAPTCMVLFRNQMVILDGFTFEFEKQFEQSFPVGDTVRIKEPHRILVQSGLGWSPTSIERRNRTVAMDETFTAQWIVESLEEALDMERTDADIKKNIIQPHMAQMANEADMRAALFAKNNIPTTVGDLNADISTLNTFSSARSRVFELSGTEPEVGGGKLIVTPSQNQGGIDNTVRALFTPSDQIDRAFKRGSLGKYGGYKWFESMNLRRHTPGTIASTFTVNGASQTGSSLNINCTSGDTFVQGDHISIANVQATNFMNRATVGRVRHFVLTANVTATAATATLSIFPSIIGPGSPYQNVNALAADAATITHMPGTTSPSGNSGVFGLAFLKNAFACVGGKLPMPKKGTKEIAESYTDPQTGIQIAFIQDFNTRDRQRDSRMDCLMGFGRLWSEFAAARIASDT